MTIKKSKKTRPRSSEMSLEIIGGLFFVEKFKDGTERREEIDGKAVLQLLIQILTDHAERVIGEHKK